MSECKQTSFAIIANLLPKGDEPAKDFIFRFMLKDYTNSKYKIDMMRLKDQLTDENETVN